MSSDQPSEATGQPSSSDQPPAGGYPTAPQPAPGQQWGGYTQPTPYGSPAQYGQPGAYPQPNPYGQPAQYPQQGGYPQPNPYGQPGAYPQQGAYPQPNPYGQPAQYGATAYPAAAPAPKSPILGIIAFALPVAALVLSIASLMPMMPAMQELIQRSAATGGSVDSTMMAEQIASQYPMAGLMMNLASLMGLAGLVVGIIAVAKKAGRGWGIAAIIAAIVAPIAMVLVLAGMLVSGLG